MKQAPFKDGLRNLRDWWFPSGWKHITTLDMHTAGEPLRIIIDGLPEIPGGTILQKRRFMKENLDWLRTALMWEPRGHADMYGCILTEPVSPEADFGVFFLHNEGYSTMCGHAILALTRAAAELGLAERRDPVTAIGIDTPAGLVRGEALWRENRIEEVRFCNVPSFVLVQDGKVEIPGLGDIRYDIAFGGAFYAFVQAQDVGLELGPEHFREIIEKGMAIKRAVAAREEIRHPFEEDLNFLYGTIFIEAPHSTRAHSRNVCVFAEGEVDRSPTGTGVSARMALHHARGEIGIDEPMIIESIIGTTFTGRIKETVTFGEHKAVIPEVTGMAYITGRNYFAIDPEDPLREGFILR